MLYVCKCKYIFPQQRKLMGSSAQNSSGMHWCRRRVRFNQVPEKVPKVPEKVWEALVQSRVTFNRVPEFRRRSGRLWCRARVPQKVPKKVWEALVQSQIRFSFCRWFREAQVQQGSEEGSGRLWCRARSGSTGFRTRFRRREGSGEGSGRLWRRARSGSSPTRFRRTFRRRSGRLCAVPGQVQ